MDSNRAIRQARIRAGLSQSELARRIGTTQSAVSRWESGAVRPSLERLHDIVRACGLDLQWRIAEPADDEYDLASLEGQLELTPEERFRQLVRTVRFIEAGRRARRRGAGSDAR